MELLPIGVVSARSGMAPSALRYYEEQGLLPAATRTPGAPAGTRGPCCAGWPSSGRRATSGCPCRRSARRWRGCPDDRPPTRADWERLSSEWRDRLDEQISALTELRDGLSSCIGCGCLSLARCALFNPGDVAAAEGPGARRLPPALRRTVPR